MDSIISKQVAIVSFLQDTRNAEMLAALHHPAPRVVSYQVTLDPARVSPGGEFVRFGQWGDQQGQGDEITGWVLLADLVLEEILAEHDGLAFRPAVQSAERAA